jgi:glycosyltransferase involved in cell wall biosynthesis
VLVMPSRLEPWGVAIIEALAGGLEVICTAACGASDIVVAANAGIILPRGRVSEIVRAMLAMTSRAPSEAVARTARQAAAPFRPSEWAESLRRFPTLIAASPMRTRSIR